MNQNSDLPIKQPVLVLGSGLNADAINDPAYLAKLTSGRDAVLDICGTVIEIDTTDFEVVDLEGLVGRLSEYL